MEERARYCEFERLGNGEMNTEDELIMLCLIDGMHDPAFKHKLLEMLQSVRNMYRVRASTGINKKV